MICINYTKAGAPLADHVAEAWIDLLIAEHKKHPNEMIKAATSSAILVTAARLRVATGVVSPNEIEIQFEGETLPLNAHGAIDNNCWPKGFCDHEIEMYVKIARAGHNPKETHTT